MRLKQVKTFLERVIALIKDNGRITDEPRQMHILLSLGWFVGLLGTTWDPTSCFDVDPKPNKEHFEVDTRAESKNHTAICVPKICRPRIF